MRNEAKELLHVPFPGLVVIPVPVGGGAVANRPHTPSDANDYGCVGADLQQRFMPPQVERL